MKTTFSFLLCILSFFVLGQETNFNNTSGTKTAQPKIMVVPYVKNGQDIRTVMDEDFNTRIAVTKIKEAFDTRGFVTIDFTAKLKSSVQNTAFTSENQNDFKTSLLENSGADIYVQTELNIDKSNNGSNATIILTGFEVATGNSLSNKVASSGRFVTEDIGKLVEKAFLTTQEDFMNVLSERFNEIVENGRSIIIEFNFAQGSALNLDSTVGPDNKALSDIIEDWIDQNAYKHNYNLQGMTESKAIYDDVRIPVLDPKNGRNYTPNKFGQEIVNFLKTFNLKTSRNAVRQNLFITFQ